MIINLITNLNGVGLEQDANLCAEILEPAGYDCRILSYYGPAKPADLNIFFEILEAADRHIAKAAKNAFIPNPEWLLGWFGTIGKMDAVWVKSEAHIKPLARWNRRTELIRFTSRDLYEPAEKEWSFIHLAGKSDAKNTDVILQAWAGRPDLPELTIIVHPSKYRKYSRWSHLPNVRFINQYLSDDDLKTELNRHRFHLCPSKVEGWGHYIVEAMSTGGVVLTTAGPPMNEHVISSRGFTIRTCGKQVIHKAVAFRVNYGAILEAVDSAIDTDVAILDKLGENAREWYLENDRTFRKLLPEKVNAIFAV